MPVKRIIPDPGSWTFKTPHVAAAFDAHVREQLPWYEIATGIVAHVARHYVQEGGVVVDVGASTGNVGRALEPMLKARSARMVAIDQSREMVAAYTGPGECRLEDARTFDFAAERPDLVVCFLSLMFVPVRQRASVVDAIFSAIVPGGAVVVFDKMVPRPGYVGTVAYRLTLAAKREAGASAEEVIAKELSLAGVQRPMSDGELAGFDEVFRFGDFAGFVREKTV